MTAEPIAVVGMGCVSAAGIGVQRYFDSLCRGESAVGPIRSFDASRFRCRIASEVHDEALEREVERSGLGHASAMSVLATREALGVDGAAGGDTRRTGLVVGTITGNSRTFFDRYDELEGGSSGEEARRALDAFALPRVAADVARSLGLGGPRWTISNACATGTCAIAFAARLLRRGVVDRAVVIGVDAIRCLSVLSLDSLRVLARKAIRPFDKRRRGTIVGEGAGVLVLERRADVAPGAAVHAVVAGYGESCDPQHIVSPSPDGGGMVRAMRAALDQAGLSPEDVDYVNAHGTGTPTNDRIESLAIRLLLGDRAERVPVSSIKSMIGHAGGAAGTLEAIATIKTLETGAIPPTINYEEPDPDCDLDYVPNEMRTATVSCGLSNSFGFGGINATVALLRAS